MRRPSAPSSHPRPRLIVEPASTTQEAVPLPPALKKLKLLLDMGSPRCFERGSTLLTQDTATSELFVIMDGFAGAYYLPDLPNCEDTEECMPDIFGPGDVVGLESFGGSECVASVRALNGVRASAVRLDDARRAFETSTDVRKLISRIMTRAIQRGVEKHAILASAVTASGRMLFFLTDLVDRFGIRTKRGIEIHVPLGRYELGRLVGAREETVMRIVSAITKDGLIIQDGQLSNGGSFVIPDFERLQREMPVTRTYRDKF